MGNVQQQGDPLPPGKIKLGRLDQMIQTATIHELGYMGDKFFFSQVLLIFERITVRVILQLWFG